MLHYERIILVNNYAEYRQTIERYFNTQMRNDYGGNYIIDNALQIRVDIQSVNSKQAISMLNGCTYNTVVIIDKDRIDDYLLEEVMKRIRMGNDKLQVIYLEKYPENLKEVGEVVTNNKDNDDLEVVEKPKSVKVEVKKDVRKQTSSSKQASGLQKTTHQQ